MKSPSLTRAAGTVALAFVFSQLAGLARSIIVAQAFGASAELDAFSAANRVSETLFNLVAGGALGSAFIPAFAGFLAKDDKDSAWKLAVALARLVTLTLSGLAVIAAIFAPQIASALAPGFVSEPRLLALTVDLLRIQLVSAVLFGLGGLLVGILNAQQVFLVPALTPAMYQFGLIFGALALAPSLGIYGLAWGVVIGSGFYLLIQVPPVLRFFRSQTTPNLPQLPYWGIKDASVTNVLMLMVPRLFGVAVVQLNFWVNIALASGMGFGSVSAVQYGFALMLMAQAVIAQSAAIAIMPTLSAQFALGKLDEMRVTLVSALRGVILLALPASVGLMMLREPLIRLLYERGEFDARATEMVAWALLWYAAGMTGHAVLEVLSRAFYAAKDTATPVRVGIAAMLLNVAFSFAFSAAFRAIGWMPHGGLALANSLATALEALVLFALMQKRLSGMPVLPVATGLLQAGAAALAMSLALGWWLTLGLNPLWSALAGVGLGGAVYGLGLWLLRVNELQIIMQWLLKRLRP
jgi:putative peptidoglycan lipid II flippase